MTKLRETDQKRLRWETADLRPDHDLLQGQRRGIISPKRGRRAQSCRRSKRCQMVLPKSRHMARPVGRERATCGLEIQAALLSSQAQRHLTTQPDGPVAEWRRSALV